MIDKLGYLLKHSTVYTIATLFQKMTGFFLLTLLTDTTLVSKEENSLFNFFITSVLVFTNLFSLGVEASIVRFIKLYPEQKKRILASATQIIFFFFLIGLLLISFNQSFLAQFALRDSRYSELVFLIGLVGMFDMFFGIPQYYFRASERPVVFTLFKILRFLTEIIFVYVGLKYFDLGILGAIYGLLFSSFLNFLFVTPFYYRFLSIKVDRKLIKRMIFFGAPLVPNAIMYLFIELQDRYFLDAFVSKEVQVAYTNMYKFAAILTVINSAFRSAFQPIMLKEAKKGDKGYFRTVLNYFVMISSVVVIFASLLVVDFVRYNPIDFIKGLIHDEFYYSQTHLLGFILCGYLFLGIYYNFSLAYYLKNKSYIFVRFTFIALLVNFSLNFIMIYFPNYGTEIAACATTISYAVMAILSYLKSRSLYFVSYDLRKVGIMFIYVFFVLFVSSYGAELSFKVKFLIALLYIPYLLVTGVLSKQDLFYVLKKGFPKLK